MRESIEKAFPRTLENSCLEIISSPQFEVIDKEVSRCIWQDGHSESGHLWVNNMSQKDIHFLAIDKCLFFDKDNDPSRCDCALFDENRICFVEIKVTNPTKRSVRRAKAIQQLAKTINLFRNSKVNCNSVEAYICFSNKFPKNSSVDLNKKLEFELECGAVLKETNQIEF
jgi:hypothetical protein